MREEQPGYHSYLLRIWQVTENHKVGWRASLEQVETGVLQAFPSLEALFTYLEETTKDEYLVNSP